MAAGLDARQRRFVEEYLIDLNATQAAIRAGYSAKTAKSQASRLLTNVYVSAAISRAQEKRSARTGVTQDRILLELAKIGFSDIRKAVKWRANVTEMEFDEETGEQRLSVSNQVQIIDSDEIDDDTAGAIAEISQSDKGALKIKFYDKRAALVDMGRHVGMFKGTGEDDTDAQSLNINIHVRDAVSDVRVTQSEQASGDLPDGAGDQV